jgi:outer membrane murein-binding lipoprotein Lpp
MKKLSLTLFAVVILGAAGCSRSNKPETSAKPPSNPDAERLKSDSERLQQATAKAARAREEESRANLTPTPSASP